MNPNSLTAQIIAALMNLRTEFDGWWIHHAESGRWTASKRDWGTLHGQSAPELRDRLTQHAREVRP